MSADVIPLRRAESRITAGQLGGRHLGRMVTVQLGGGAEVTDTLEWLLVSRGDVVEVGMRLTRADAKAGFDGRFSLPADSVVVVHPAR